MNMEQTKIAKYKFLAEPFHCDYSNHLFMGLLGNHLLNAADFHSTERGFGMNYLMPRHKTWVLSRLVIEMDEMPSSYDDFYVETWVESAMRYFTSRNYAISAADGHMLGYGRSVWAMIDTQSRQPTDIFSIHDGAINNYIDKDYPCPIASPSRVKMGDEAVKVMELKTRYNDVDINGHINSVKYIEHVLDLFPVDWYKSHFLKRFEIAYVAEAHGGDVLTFYQEQTADGAYCIRITKRADDDATETEVARGKAVFIEK